MEIEEVAAHIVGLRDLDKLVLVNKRGVPAVRVGWVVTLFFAEGETLEQRLLANRVLRDFLATFEAHITHYHPVDSQRLKAIGGLDVAASCDNEARAATARDGRDANDAYSADLYGFPGGKDVMQPAPFYLGISTAYRQRPAASNVVANFPLTWFPADGGPAQAIALFTRWCGILRPAHGTMSPGLVFTQGGAPGNDFLPAYAMVQRFPGLDYVDASRWKAESRAAPRRIRTIGWLTALDDGFVAELGGLPRIQAELGADVHVHAFPGGIVLQAGPEPRLGDRNRGQVPAHYRAVARLVQPLVFDAFPRGIFHPLPAALDPAEETRKWLRRFD